METLSELAHGLLQHEDVQLHVCKTKQEVLALLAKETISAVLVGEAADGEDPKTIVTDITTGFPMVNCAIVSDLPPAEFHEWTEGLGVFTQLSPKPSREAAITIVETLRKFDSWLTGLGQKGAEL